LGSTRGSVVWHREETIAAGTRGARLALVLRRTGVAAGAIAQRSMACSGLDPGPAPGLDPGGARRRPFSCGTSPFSGAAFPPDVGFIDRFPRLAGASMRATRENRRDINRMFCISRSQWFSSGRACRGDVRVRIPRDAPFVRREFPLRMGSLVHFFALAGDAARPARPSHRAMTTGAVMWGVTPPSTTSRTCKCGKAAITVTPWRETWGATSAPASDPWSRKKMTRQSISCLA